MSLALALPVGLLQAAAVQDTLVVARMLPQRDAFEWTTGILQIIALLLGVGMLTVMTVLLLSLRRAVVRLQVAITEITAMTRPLIARATVIASDASEVVAMVRTDVERLNTTAGVISAQVLHVVETTATRVGEVNAVLDVLQAELERGAIGTMSALHGVRVGAQALGEGLAHPRRDADAARADLGEDDDDFDDLDDFDELDEELDADLDEAFDDDFDALDDRQSEPAAGRAARKNGGVSPA
jgi:hypothetical protein